jgi:hypothetical protein
MDIPSLRESRAMLDDQRSQAVQFMRSKTVGLREVDRVKPKLGNAVAVFDVYVRRLRSFQAVKEETKAGKPQDSGHRQPRCRTYDFGG